MKQDILLQEISYFMEAFGIHTKEISLIVDNDIHINIISLRIAGDKELLFTDDNNELLRDFTAIFRLYINKKFSLYKDIIIDINGVQKKHIDYTKEKAQIAVDRVLFFDKPYEFGYLNAYERMIIHTYLKKYPEIMSQSEGVGKERRLVLHKNT